MSFAEVFSDITGLYTDFNAWRAGTDPTVTAFSLFRDLQELIRDGRTAFLSTPQEPTVVDIPLEYNPIPLGDTLPGMPIQENQPFFGSIFSALMA